MEATEIAGSSSIKVTAFIDQLERQNIIQSLLADTTSPFSVDIIDDYDDAMSLAGQMGQDVFIVDKNFQEDRGLDVIWELASQNRRAPAIIINEFDS